MNYKYLYQYVFKAKLFSVHNHTAIALYNFYERKKNTSECAMYTYHPIVENNGDF